MMTVEKNIEHRPFPCNVKEKNKDKKKPSLSFDLTARVVQKNTSHGTKMCNGGSEQRGNR